MITAAVVVGLLAVGIGTGLIQSDDDSDEEKHTIAAANTNIVWEVVNYTQFTMLMSDGSNAYDKSGTEGDYFTLKDASDWKDESILAGSDEWMYSFKMNDATHYISIKKSTDGHSSCVEPSIADGELRVTFGAPGDNDCYWVELTFSQTIPHRYQAYIPKVGDTFVYNILDTEHTYVVTKVPGSEG